MNTEGARPMLSDLSDEDVFALYIQTQDPDCFAVLFGRHVTGMRSFMHSRSLHGNLVEDVIQQTFINVHLCRDQFDPANKFSAWLNTIAANCTIDALRFHGRTHRKVLSLNRQPSNGRAEEYTYDPPDEEAKTPQQIVATDEAIGHLNVLISQMTPEDRVVIKTLYFEKLGYDEVVERLGISHASARQRHTRLLKFMRTKLEYMDKEIYQDVA